MLQPDWLKFGTCNENSSIWYAEFWKLQINAAMLLVKSPEVILHPYLMPKSKQTLHLFEFSSVIRVRSNMFFFTVIWILQQNACLIGWNLKISTKSFKLIGLNLRNDPKCFNLIEIETEIWNWNKIIQALISLNLEAVAKILRSDWLKFGNCK